TEIQIVPVVRNMLGYFQLDLSNPIHISDPAGTPSLDRRADGRPSVAGHPGTGEALVAWVRYTEDYLEPYTPPVFYRQLIGCTEVFCNAPEPAARPKLTATSIAVRRVDTQGVIPGEDIQTIYSPGINVQPHIEFSPTGNLAYCVWINDSIHQDLLESNRGRSLLYSVYDASTDTWSAPMDAVLFPDDYPGILEPVLVLKDDLNGMLAFTALESNAPIDDSGLGRGSRYLFASRLVNGVFEEPVRIRGRCDAREYGYSQSLFINIPEWVDPLDGLHYKRPEWVMGWQELGHIGVEEGTGNLKVSTFDDSTGIWSTPTRLLPEGTIVSNVAASISGNSVNSVHFNSGPSAQFGLGGPIVTGYQMGVHELGPDAAITRCDVDVPFASPGATVGVKVEVENQGLSSTPYDASDMSVTSLEAVFVAEDGSETVVAELPLPILEVGHLAQLDFQVEMPHRPTRLRVRVVGIPRDRDPSNDERECYLGAPAPTDASCRIISTVNEEGETELAVDLRWENPVLYDAIWLYRDGSMFRALPGRADRYVDVQVGGGLHTYEIRGVVAASKSAKTPVPCDVVPPPLGIGFVRGDANSDGEVDISDVIFSLSYLFTEGDDPACFATGDANHDGEIDISDSIYLLSYLFQG
ncbi:MAG: dockerin type I repeat-containing protein, partial [Planctomycetes bacterium]|nr:dockerin type I repeat-containing protein [Planctomycetota bacterium]